MHQRGDVRRAGGARPGPDTLAWYLAHRLRRRQDEREALLRRAVEASERERGIIAGELHDGAVQNLISQSLLAAAAADHLSGTASEETIRDLR